MKRSDRQHLAALIVDVRSWTLTAQWTRHLARHLPISGDGLGATDADTQYAWAGAAAYDVESALPLTRGRLLGGSRTTESSQAAADRLSQFHAWAISSGQPQALAASYSACLTQTETECRRLQSIVSDLERARQVGARTLDDLRHMPVSREGVMSESDLNTLRSLVSVVDQHRHGQQVLNDQVCSSGQCAPLHSAASVLAETHTESERDGVLDRVAKLALSVNAQLQAEQKQVKQLLGQVEGWPGRVEAIRKARKTAPARIARHFSGMLEKAVEIKLTRGTYRLIPVTGSDQQLLADLKLLRDLPITPADDTTLETALQEANRFVPAVRAGFRSSLTCTRDDRCVHAHQVVPETAQKATAIQTTIDRLSAPIHASGAELDRLLETSLQLDKHLRGGLRRPELLKAKVARQAMHGAPAVANAAAVAKQAAKTAKTAATTVRAADVVTALKAMDLETLKKASTDRIPIRPLTNAGLTNVYAVFELRNDLGSLPGIGGQSAWSIAQAAIRLYDGVRDETPVRIDVKRRNKRTTELLEALRSWDAARRFEPTADEVAVARAVIRLSKLKPPPTQMLAIVAGAEEPSAQVGRLLADALARSAPGSADGEVWQDFLSRPSDYFGMLTELGFMTEDEKKMHGDLPEEIVEAVRAKELRRDHLTASLRAYQSFGAKFALVQEKVVIGDEMGLGKTVEALAVLAHLHTSGQRHFLVVCPAAVVSNWIRETSKHCALRPHRLHGPLWERGHAARTWARTGGIAVTTYDLLSWAQHFLDEVDVAGAVFDEAHYIKNPHAKRSVAAQEVMDSVRHVILMTGTPLENRVQEFRNLIGYIRPDLSDSAPEYLPSKFRKHMAPAYLRRNQEDVLTELPELVEVDEWMGMSDADESAYRAAVSEGNFMLMRRAAMLSERSMKVDRLTEIVREAEANDRLVIVFSYFREVLTEVAGLLPGKVFGPLTGSVPAVERQRMVDQFTAAGGGSVLVAQITAGGIGLNIQAASVVVICEPQLKPTMESQAIARAHRMGQVNTVQVHRLLSENSVDERVREILDEKRQLFDQFARDSVIAQQAPDAVDVSDAELARMVIATERERLFGQSQEEEA